MKHGHFNASPFYHASKLGQHVTPDEHPDVKLAFKVVSAIGLGYFAYRQMKGAYQDIWKRLSSGHSPEL